MALKFSNNASTTTTVSLSDSDTTLTVVSGTGSLFPTISGTEFFYSTLADAYGNVEIVKVTARNVDTFTIVRAQDGTTHNSWPANTLFEQRLVAADLHSLGGATGGGSDDVFYENGQTVTSSYTITTSKNAMSTGPITISAGKSVTIPSGSRWVVL